MELTLQDHHLMLPKQYSGETPWHSDWKKAFPADFREITFLNKLQG